MTYWGLSRVKPNMDITYDLGFFRCLGGFFTGVIAAWMYGKLKAKRVDDFASNMTKATCIEVVVIALSIFFCLLYTSPSPRDGLLSRMPSSA